MSTFGMAMVTAFYNVHIRDKHTRAIPVNLVLRAVRYNPERVCAPLCLPSTCPILFRFLSEPDEREVSTIPSPSRSHVDGYGESL